MRKCDVGGQAIIEGVMMRGAKGLATAVRTPNGEIEVKVKRTTPITKKYKILNIPIIRGAAALIDKGANDLIITLTMMVSFFVAAGLFLGIPTAIASIFKGIGLSPILLNLIESAIRIAILITYMYFISKLDDIYRIFQYHGVLKVVKFLMIKYI